MIYRGSPAMVRGRRRIILALVGVSACAGGNHSLRSPSPRRMSPGAVITQTEIDDDPGRMAYDTIQHLRPLFLATTRAMGSSSQRWVYINGMRAGGLDALHAVPSRTIREIRLLDARESTQLFGSGHSLGVILITTRDGR